MADMPTDHNLPVAARVEPLYARAFAQFKERDMVAFRETMERVLREYDGDHADVHPFLLGKYAGCLLTNDGDPEMQELAARMPQQGEKVEGALADKLQRAVAHQNVNARRARTFLETAAPRCAHAKYLLAEMLVRGDGGRANVLRGHRLVREAIRTAEGQRKGAQTAVPAAKIERMRTFESRCELFCKTVHTEPVVYCAQCNYGHRWVPDTVQDARFADMAFCKPEDKDCLARYAKAHASGDLD